MANAHPTIGPAQLELLRRDGPAVAAWQRRVGLAEARSRCTAMVLAGAVPFVGWLGFGWSPLTMLAFLAVDVAAVLLGDAAKLALAGPAVARSHAQDYRTQQVLSIVGGLQDGTGRYTPYGRKPGVGLLFAVSVLFAAVVALLVALGIDELGLRPIAVLHEPGFPAFAGASVLLHLFGALRAGMRARRQAAADAVLFLDGGGVIGLGAGLLLLAWLPITLGAIGTVLMLAVLLLFRLAFGIFALLHIPRVTAALDRLLETPPAARPSVRHGPDREGRMREGLGKLRIGH